jgi:hypothetical protein
MLEDDDDEAVMYFSMRSRVDEGEVQIVLDDHEDGDVSAGEDVDTREGEGKGEGNRSESGTRRWSLNLLAW